MNSIGKTELDELFGFLLPGIIIVFIFSLIKPGPKTEYKFLLLYYIIASTFYFIFIRPLFEFKDGISLPLWLHSILFYIVTPIIVGVILARVLQTGKVASKTADFFKLQTLSLIEDAWDYTFYKTLNDGRYAIVTLSDGAQIYGYIGQASFVSSSRERSDLLMESVYELDDDEQWNQVEPPRSIYIKGEQITLIELIWSQNDR